MPANIATTNGKTRSHVLRRGALAPSRPEARHPRDRRGRHRGGGGLDYDVTLTDVATVDGMMVPKTKAVVRYNNQTVLGIVEYGRFISRRSARG